MTKSRQTNQNNLKSPTCMYVCMYAALSLSLAAEPAFSPREQQKRDPNSHWKLVVCQTEEGSSSSRVSPPKFLKFAKINNQDGNPNPHVRMQLSFFLLLLPRLRFHLENNN